LCDNIGVLAGGVPQDFDSEGDIPLRKPEVGERVWWKVAGEAHSGVVVAIRRDGTTTVRPDEGQEVEIGLDRIYRRERVRS
jgi:hypothetical protein